VFDCIEVFYNPVRHHGTNNCLSPVKFERQYFEKQAGIQDIGSGSVLR